jgi:hypothetical protein
MITPSYSANEKKMGLNQPVFVLLCIFVDGVLKHIHVVRCLDTHLLLPHLTRCGMFLEQGNLVWNGLANSKAYGPAGADFSFCILE